MIDTRELKVEPNIEIISYNINLFGLLNVLSGCKRGCSRNLKIVSKCFKVDS